LALSAKVFRVKTYLPLDIIADKIRSFRTLDEVEGVEVSKSFDNVRIIGDILKAYFIFDEPRMMNIQGELRRLPVRREALVAFKEEFGDILLVVFEKKFRANRIANIVSEVLFAKTGEVVETSISHELLKSLHESNPEGTKVIYFDNVDIPNVNKLALYGSALADTSLYNMYLDHGRIWYVVFHHQDTDYIVGLTRNLIIAMFSKITLDDFLDYIVKYVTPLLYSST
jgi:hypothetical protein